MRKKRALLNISTNLILQFVVLIYGFIVPKIIIMNFGSEINGLTTSIRQFLNYIILLESGLGKVIISNLYKPIAKKDKNQILAILKFAESFFKKIALIFIIYILFLSFLYPQFVETGYDKIFTASLILIISISTFFEYFFGITYRLFLQANQEVYAVSIIQIFVYLLNLISILIMTYFKLSIHVIMLVNGLIFVMRPLLQNYYVRRKYDIYLNQFKYKQDIKDKWNGVAQHIAYVIHINTDVTLLTIFSNLKEVSVYSVYQLVINGLSNIISSVSSALDASWGDMIAKGEHENLNKKFNLYEVIYFSIITILFTCGFILIIPFVQTYVGENTDINYIRPLFGFILMLSGFVSAMRLPYTSLVLSAGKFKETMYGSWVECLLNISISLILLKNFGLVGVAIGTTVAISIRGIEFIYHANKTILNREMRKTYIKIGISLFEITLLYFISTKVKLLDNTSFYNFIINGIFVFIFTTISILIFNRLFFKEEMKYLFSQINLIIKKKK